MKNKTNGSDISVVAPLLTLIIFSTCILLVLLFGTKLYKETLNRDKLQYEKRTADQYIMTRIRQNDAEGNIFIGTFENPEPMKNGDTLFCVETIKGIDYHTRIYCHEGYLYELFSETGLEFNREDGEKVLPLEDIYFEMEENTVIIKVSHSEGKTDSFTAVIRSYNGESYEK